MYSRNFGAGAELDLSLVTGFSSSVSTFTSYVSSRRAPTQLNRGHEGSKREQGGETISAFSVGSQQFVYREVGAFTLVAHAPADDGEEVVRKQLQEAEALLVFFFGDSAKWKRELLGLRGVHDIVDGVFEKHSAELSALVSGLRWVLLPPTVRDRLDRLLATLEENDFVHGGMLVLGSSVLHSRLPQRDSKMVLHYISSRQLGPLRLRTTPVYSEGQWKNLVLLKLRVLTLAVLVSIRVAYASVSPVLHGFEEALQDAALQLPVEEPPVLLRHFTGHDTIAFIYRHVRNGLAIAPPPRSGPQSEKQKTLRSFLWFFSRARDVLARSDIHELVMSRDGFRFHAQAHESHELYVLYSDQVKAGDVDKFSREIITNAMRKIGGED